MLDKVWWSLIRVLQTCIANIHFQCITKWKYICYSFKRTGSWTGWQNGLLHVVSQGLRLMKALTYLICDFQGCSQGHPSQKRGTWRSGQFSWARSRNSIVIYVYILLARTQSHGPAKEIGKCSWAVSKKKRGKYGFQWATSSPLSYTLYGNVWDFFCILDLFYSINPFDSLVKLTDLFSEYFKIYKIMNRTTKQANSI